MYENQGVSESREKSQFSLQSVVGIPSISVLLEKDSLPLEKDIQ